MIARQANHPDALSKLREMLGPIVPSHRACGRVHEYFVAKYGFHSNCIVVPVSGDNPCSLAGMGLSEAGDVGISLGTSTTLMGVVPDKYNHQEGGSSGHFFRNPFLNV